MARLMCSPQIFLPQHKAQYGMTQTTFCPSTAFLMFAFTHLRCQSKMPLSRKKSYAHEAGLLPGKRTALPQPLAAGGCPSSPPAGMGWWQCLARLLMGFPVASWIFSSSSVQAVLRKWWKTSWKRESTVLLKSNACPTPVGLHSFGCLLSMTENSSICRVGGLLAFNVKLILAAYIYWGEYAVNTIYHAWDLDWEWHFDEI